MYHLHGCRRLKRRASALKCWRVRLALGDFRVNATSCSVAGRECNFIEISFNVADYCKKALSARNRIGKRNGVAGVEGSDGVKRRCGSGR